MQPPVDSLEAAAYTIPTDRAEADGTLAWSSTTMVTVTANAGGCSGLGWTYAPAPAARLVEDLLGPVVVGRPALDVPGAAAAVRAAVRNAGWPGVAGCAASAVDVALWDLKARLLDVPLTGLLGRAQADVPLYGSGGFTTYDDASLRQQVDGWLAEGMDHVKIKIGEDAGRAEHRDLRRARLVRSSVPDRVEVFVDANGGYARKQAIRMGRLLSAAGVTWFEEPVTSEDKQGLHEVRAAVDLDVAAGEYATDPAEFRRLCEVVDCLQVDATRCGGITGWLHACAIAASFGLDVSGHCAPHLHAAVASATPNLRHLEWFSDHVRLEQRFLEGALAATHGTIRPTTSDAGHGFALREADLAPYRV